MKRLIATDYDGTLRINGKISDSDREKIAAFRAAGNYFGIVTGRGSDFFKTVKDEGLQVDYLIVYTGALIIDAEENVLFEAPIPFDDFVKLEKFFEKRADVEWYEKARAGEKYYQYYATCKDQTTALSVAALAEKEFGGIFEYFVNGPHINICGKGISKASGIREILKYYGIPEEAAAPVGDDYNDIRMIEELNGWAVSSGRAEVVKLAPHVCESVGDLAQILIENG